MKTKTVKAITVVAKRAAPKAKPAAKAVAKVATKAPTKSVAKPTLNAAVAKPIVATQQVAKQKLVRDSFTLPETDHDLIKQCKKAAVVSGRETKKSEVVRAAIHVFSRMPIAAQLSAYASLQTIVVGRPKSK